MSDHNFDLFKEKMAKPSPGRVHLLEKVAELMGPETVLGSGDAELSQRFRVVADEIKRGSHPGLSLGAMAGFLTGDLASDDGSLTAKGIVYLREAARRMLGA